jgi:GT2 family glycosyltransferase
MAGFDQEFSGWGGDDTDLGLRMEERGVPIYNVPDAHCYHHDAKKLDYVVKQYVTFGRVVYPLLLKKHPGKIIFKNGWLLGLPDSQSTLSRRLAATLLAPLRTGPSLAALRILARFRGGALFSDKLFDWLFYGHLASGFRESRR